MSSSPQPPCARRLSMARRAAAALAAVAALAGCAASSGASDPAPPAAAPTPAAGASLQPGAYPVAGVQARNRATPSVTPGGYALVAAGDPVAVTTADGAHVVLTALGPDVQLASPAAGQPYAQQAPGVLTVEVTTEDRPVTLSAADLLVLDQAQHPMAVAADSPSVTATPGHPAAVRLSGTFDSGHTTLTWQPKRRPAVTWDFVVELD